MVKRMINVNSIKNCATKKIIRRTKFRATYKLTECSIIKRSSLNDKKFSWNALILQIKVFCSRHLFKEIELIFKMIIIIYIYSDIFWQSLFPSPLVLKTEKNCSTFFRNIHFRLSISRIVCNQNADRQANLKDVA